jgi:phosphogluconate dehydratase
VRVDAGDNCLQVMVAEEVLAARVPADVTPSAEGLGRELFARMRALSSSAEDGASILM